MKSIELGRVGLMTLASAALLVASAGCRSTETRTNDSGPTAQASDANEGRVTRAGYRPRAGEGMAVSSLSFPTGDPDTSAIDLFTVMPQEVIAGSEFEYEYHVANRSGGTLQNVALLIESVSNLEVVSAEPQGNPGPNGTTFALGDLGPNEAQVIRVRARAPQTGSATNCVSVSYNNVLCQSVNVVQPALQLVKSAPERTLLCDPFEITYTLTNSGTGSAREVTLRDTLPEGLVIAGTDSREVNVTLPQPLSAGESKNVIVEVEARRAGTYASGASASAGQLEASSGQPTTVVAAPSLTLECRTPSQQFTGRNANFEFLVTNNGNAVARDTVVSVNFASGAQIARVSDGGAATGNAVNFNVGALEPGESRVLSVAATSTTRGALSVEASANAYCAEPVSSACAVLFEGIPAILLEVVDDKDPVEVGDTTTYIIEVKNQGSAADTNIRIVATLPDEQTFVSGDGVTGVTSQGQVVRTEPLDTLEPGEVVVWRITVRANAVGNIRFAVELTSDQFQRPVNETEATNLYEVK